MNKQEVEALCSPQRWESFWKLYEYAHSIKTALIVETGTYRGIPADGESTLFFAKLALEMGARFVSLDICPVHVERSKEHLVKHQLASVVECIDSVTYLSQLVQSIDVLYLDSYDYEPHNPLPAQIHQVAELGAAYGKLHNKSIVLLDDCNIPGGGKGLLTDQFLQARGWKLVHDAYQKLYTR